MRRNGKPKPPLATLSEQDLQLYRQKLGLAQQYALVAEALRGQLRQYERELRARYNLPVRFTLDVVTGAVAAAPESPSG